MAVLLQHPYRSPASKYVFDGGIKAFILHIRSLGSTKCDLSPFLWCHNYGSDFVLLSQVMFSLNVMEELPALGIMQLDTGVLHCVSN